MFIKITLMENGKPGPSYIEKMNNVDIDALFDGAETGETYQLEKVSLKEEDFDRLPEFTGF